MRCMNPMHRVRGEQRGARDGSRTALNFEPIIAKNDETLILISTTDISWRVGKKERGRVTYFAFWEFQDGSPISFLAKVALGRLEG